MSETDRDRALTREEVRDLLPEVPGWELKDGESSPRLRRSFEFSDFKEALAFVNRVGDLAEMEGHHPDVHLTDFNKVTLETWSHSLGGLHRNDFVLAAKVNRLA